jgi:hypothetical protein
MKTRNSNIQDIITIQPIALNFFQFFSIDDIQAYQSVNRSTASITQQFMKNTIIKNRLGMKEKTLMLLQQDAKTMKEYLSNIRNPIERAQIEKQLAEMEQGKVNKEVLSSLMVKEWKYDSKAQQTCKDISECTRSLSKSYYEHHLKNSDKVEKHDVVILGFLLGLSGLSYLTNLTIEIVNDYLTKPIKQKFQAHLRFVSQHIDREERQDREEDNNPPGPSI